MEITGINLAGFLRNPKTEQTEISEACPAENVNPCEELLPRLFQTADEIRTQTFLL